jgi:TonB family protein
MGESHMKTLEGVPAPDFASLPEYQGRWGSFGVSFVLQVAMLVAITKTTISFVAPVLNPIDTYENVHLVAPELKSPPPVPEQVAKVKQLPITPRVQVRLPKQTPPPIEAPKAPVQVTKVVPPPLPAPVVKTDTFRSPALAAKVPRPVISTDFGGSSASATVNKPARQVQTGGFGDPNGVPGNPNSTGKGPIIAKVGSFDLPTGGPGAGNGSGGTTGVRGTVASAGFGNGIATQGEGGPAGQKKVESTNFGSVRPISDAPKHQVAAAVPKETPVSLLTKPTPNYTAEARQRKIEGDVELDVEFSATGQVHVLRVLQGLGYGLDEAAVKAAENIRFAPARRDGQAVDAHGRLRIVFRLS